MSPGLEGELDVLAGTRMLMAGRSIRRGFTRHVQGRLFATVVERLFGLGFYDTQCGLKLVRAALLRPLLPRLREERWLLDVELLSLLQREGARVREEPIDWADPGGSKLVPGLDALRMAAGLRRIRDRRRPNVQGRRDTSKHVEGRPNTSQHVATRLTMTERDWARLSVTARLGAHRRVPARIGAFGM
jgi:dolichyl-phosphate beta-glucosyltransferase